MMKRISVQILVVFVYTFCSFKPNTLYPKDHPLPKVKYSEVIAYLEDHKDKKLDMTVLWKRLDIVQDIPNKDTRYLFKYNPVKDDKCVVKKYHSYKVFSSHVRSVDDNKKVKLIRITAHLNWCCQFLVFKKEKKQWLYCGHIDFIHCGYGSKPGVRFYPHINNSVLFSIVNLGHTGTAVSGITIHFFKIIDGRVKKILSFLKKGYLAGWGTTRWKEYEAVIWPKHYSVKDIGMTYFIRYSAVPCKEYQPVIKDKKLRLFSVKKDIIYTWDDERKEYKFKNPISEVDKKIVKAICFLPVEEFYTQYKTEIQELAVKGKNYQKQWVKAILKRVEEVEKKEKKNKE